MKVNMMSSSVRQSMHNQGVNNLTNIVRSNYVNPCTNSEVKRNQFDIHDRMARGVAKDRMFISRMRELEIKKNNNEITDESYSAYVNCMSDSNLASKLINADDKRHSPRSIGQIDGQIDDSTDCQIDDRNDKNNILLGQLFDILYPIGTIYTRSINELPFEFGKWSPIDSYDECPNEKCNEFKWIRNE